MGSGSRTQTAFLPLEYSFLNFNFEKVFDFKYSVCLECRGH